ncbi:MAG: tryptophan synthase subunit alpha [Kiritimatiellae bacterium]|nr:tryptophan synthase subunit alpha [Kiritimatiellia bacterium]
MKTRIEQRFADLAAKKQKGFIAYITAGDPTLAATEDFVLRLADAGVDVIELGIPFSDPLADGRVNQASATRALTAGTTPGGVLEMVARIRKRSEIPLMGYSYMNLIHARGVDRFMREAAEAGLDGLLMLDLPVEESAPYLKVLKKNALDYIALVTPTTPDERIKKIVQLASGFIYCVSREGVTGIQDKLSSKAISLVRRTKSLTPLPVALGFGIGTPAQAHKAAAAADAVVVGSAIVNRLYTEPHTGKGRQAAADFVGTLVKAVKGVS